MREPETDLIPEHLAVRRGLDYQKDAQGRISRAQHRHPLLIDRLYERRVLGHDHHFYGVQFLTMRKLTLRDVSVKVGMLRVKSEEGAAEEKPIPMEDNDSLKVLRRMHNGPWKKIVLEVCDEAADPMLADRYGLMRHQVGAAFDQLVDAVQALWEEKKRAKDAANGPDERFR